MSPLCVETFLSRFRHVRALEFSGGRSIVRDHLIPTARHGTRSVSLSNYYPILCLIGLNRVQPAPKTSRKMHAILHRAQTSIGYWVGSSVVHMGESGHLDTRIFCIDTYQATTTCRMRISSWISTPKCTGSLCQYATPWPRYRT